MSIATQSTSGSSTLAGTASSRALPESCRLAAARARPFESQAVLVLVVDGRGRLLYAGPRWERIFGTPPASPLGRPLLEVVLAERFANGDGEALAGALRRALFDGAADPIPLRYRERDGAARALEGRAYGPPDDERLVVFHDVTRQLEDLQSLVAREARFRSVAEASRDVVTEVDSRGRLLYASPACREVLGYSAEELMGGERLRLHHPDDLERVQAEVRAARASDGPFAVGPHRLRHKNGHWVWMEGTGVRSRGPGGDARFLGVGRDVTDRIESEAEKREVDGRLVRSQKLESLGALAGGIAHDFNNLLTPIVGNAGLLLADLPESSPARRWAGAIRDAAHRATALTTQMLAYAGQTGRQLVEMDVSAVVEGVSLLLETTASSACRVHLELARDLPTVHGDAAQVTQMVMNLVANASDALGADGGRIDVRTRALDTDPGFLEQSYLGEGREGGVFTAIEVADDGPGLDPEIRERIFDPFFSTKSTGRGLGLAVVLATVQAHEGALQIESEPGRGSCFRVLLPARRPVRSAGRPPCPPTPRADATPPSAGLLLVVDDDAARELTVTLLERAGFAVLSARSGPEAVALFRRRASEIDGVLLDGTMPGMSSARVRERLVELDPRVRLMIVSGHAPPASPGDREAFLHKPYEADALLAAIQQLLAPG